jgi:ribonuclease-3
LPVYDVTDIRGQAPKQEFVVRCALSDSDQAYEAQGTSRRRAEQAAATLALAALEGKS